MKLLIVDDNPINRKLLRVTLETEGFDTVEAEDGMEALARLEEHPVDVIISDIFMPRMDGFRFCNEVRRSERFRQLPIVIYTSTYTSASDQKLAFESGADKYVRKPCPTEMMVRAVREAATEARARSGHAPSPPEELHVTREYSEALVHKLEEKKSELEAAAERHKMLAELSQLALANHADVMDQAVGVAARALSVPYCGIWQRLEAGGLQLRAGTGWVDAVAARPTVSDLIEWPATWALETKEPTVVENLLQDKRYRQSFLDQYGIVSTLSVVIHGSSRPLGVLEVYGTEPRRFTPDDVHFIQGVANVVAAAVQRREGEESLREREEFIQRVLDSSHDVIKVLDLDGRLLSMSRGGQLLLEIPDLGPYIGQPWTDLWKGKDVANVARALDEARNGQPASFQGFRPTASGQPKWWDVIVSPILGPDGRPEHLLAVSRDITEWRAAEEELARVNIELQEAHKDLEEKVAERTAELQLQTVRLRRLAGQLTNAEQSERRRLASVLHDDLQQLLVGAKLRLEIIARNPLNSSKAAKEAEELLMQSIQLSRSLTAELSPPILQHGGLIEGINWLARRMSERHGLSVAVDIVDEAEDASEEMAVVLFQSVRELLFNVVKHACVNSATLSVRRVDGRIKITVSDRGGGFDLSRLESASQSGAGFGLFSIAERLRSMGGEVKIESRLGYGTTVALEAPLQNGSAEPRAEDSASVPQKEQDEFSAPPVSAAIRVLIVDDHAVMRQGLSGLLDNEADIEVIGEAPDGAAAVEMVRSLKPEVVLMDISMPNLNGIEATRIIHSELPDVKVIGLSMFEAADQAQAMKNAGAVEYLTKSCAADCVVAAIRRSADLKVPETVP